MPLAAETAADSETALDGEAGRGKILLSQSLTDAERQKVLGHYFTDRFFEFIKIFYL